MTRWIFSFVVAFALIAGCASAPKQVIEPKGDVVAQGIGQLSFRAPGPGLVSIYDVSDNSVISSTAVESGSVVSLNPAAGNITVTDVSHAGTQVVHTGINKSHQYELWFISRTYNPSVATQPLR
jgi:hypothetical protein